MNEYRVKITVRNNLLLSAIEQAGFKTITAFADACEVSPTQINQLIGLKIAPIKRSTGVFRECAKKAMEVLGACPTDLWTDRQLTMELLHNTGQREIGEAYFDNLIENHVVQMTLPDPADALEAKEAENIISEVLDTLTPREQKVIQLRYGIGYEEHTLADTGKAMGVTQERIRQIEGKCFRLLREPKRRELFAGIET